MHWHFHHFPLHQSPPGNPLLLPWRTQESFHFSSSAHPCATTIINNHVSNFENSSSGGRVACGVLSILPHRSWVQFSSLRAVGNLSNSLFSSWKWAGNHLHGVWEICFYSTGCSQISTLRSVLTLDLCKVCAWVLVCIGLGPIPKMSAGHFFPFVVVVFILSIYDLHRQSRESRTSKYIA